MLEIIEIVMTNTSLSLLISILLLSILLFIGCEKEITVEIPDAELQIVVEGNIETNQPPFILLTNSQGYFAPTDINTITNNYVHDAIITIDDGTNNVTLTELCTANLSPELLSIVVNATGLSEEQLIVLNLCFYSTFNPDMFGTEGKTYHLDITTGEDHLTSTTKIPHAVPLDSVWFELSGESDSLGFAHGFLSDPDTLENIYRWFAKRINKYPEWSDHAGDVKDQSFLAPFGSINEDEFFNGLSFEFLYPRGSTFNSSKTDDNNDERGYFKVGDTIVVKEAMLDYGAFQFFYGLESQLANSGSPFATPTDVPSNIDGGLGVFVGYGVHYDTIICSP